MSIFHIVPGTDDAANGMVVVAKLLAKEQGDAEVVDLKSVIHWNIVSDMTGRSGVSPLQGKGGFDFFKKRRDAASPSQCDEPVEGKCEDVEEVWVHGMWLPKEWLACWRVLRARKRLVRMTHGSLSPVYLKYQSPFKKWLVGPIERFLLRRSAKIVATCEAEKGWIRSYLGKHCPPVEVTDIRRFFNLNHEIHKIHENIGKQVRPNFQCLKLLYLGRRHPLKGVEYLEKAVAELNSNPVNPVQNSSTRSTCSTRLKIVSSAFGEELEKVWDWCDVLVLPTLSDNFGLVIAEALERGKRVITTDGAPAWEDGLSRVERVDRVEGELWSGYGGRLIYLKGYRDGTPTEHVELLKHALSSLVSGLTSK